MRGSWKVEESSDSKALNYWWGLSAGVIDVICSNNLPVGTTKLVNLMKQSISTGIFHPFAGPLTDQDGTLRCGETDILKPEEIMTMNWLADNVIGTIPVIDELEDAAKPVVQLRGVDITTPDKGGDIFAMKILVLADEESKYLWDYFEKDKLEGIDLIISCGDLKPQYLSFLATYAKAPILYVHGNHDAVYDETPPEGCICIDGDIYVYNGIRILGLGGL